MSKKFSNVAISTLAASATVAAVAPAAVSADDSEAVDFSDVDQESNPHYNAIKELVNQGAIDGYGDGTFAPFESVERGQIAKILAETLELDTPNDVESVVKQYSDVNASDTYADDIAAVTEAGIFAGNGGAFNPYNDISRQQMAKVITEAFNLDKYDSGDDVAINTDADQIGSTYTAYLQTLANLGITQNADSFNGTNSLQRDQFASFVVRTQNVVEENAPGVENIETQVNNDNVFTISGKATGIADAVHLVVKDQDGNKVVDNENIELDNDGNFSFTTDDSLVAGDYTYTIMGVENGNINTENDKEDSFEVEAPAIEDFDNLNVFTDKSLDSLELPEDVEVTYADETSKTKSVKWNTDNLDLSTSGEYIIHGDVSSVSEDAVIKVIVQNEYPEQVELDHEKQTLKTDETLQLEPSLTPEDVEKDNLSWSSDNQTVAEVDDQGQITAKKEGNATITVETQNGLTDTVSIEVSNRPDLTTNAYGNVITGNIIKKFSINVTNNDSSEVAIDKVEIYEQGDLYSTYTPDDLKASDIPAKISGHDNWGMSISSKLGIFQEGSYVKIYVTSDGETYEYRDSLESEEW